MKGRRGKKKKIKVGEVICFHVCYFLYWDQLDEFVCLFFFLEGGGGVLVLREEEVFWRLGCNSGSGSCVGFVGISEI